MTDADEEEVRRQVREAIAALFEADTPEDRFVGLSRLLKAWPSLHSDVRMMRQETGNELRADGWSYAAIGDLVGVTESRARHIVKGIVRPVRDKAKAAKDDAEGEESPE